MSERDELLRAAELCPVPTDEDMAELDAIRQASRGAFSRQVSRSGDEARVQSYVATLAAKLRHAWRFRKAADVLLRASLESERSNNG